MAWRAHKGWLPATASNRHAPRTASGSFTFRRGGFVTARPSDHSHHRALAAQGATLPCDEATTALSAFGLPKVTPRRDHAGGHGEVGLMLWWAVMALSTGGG